MKYFVTTGTSLSRSSTCWKVANSPDRSGPPTGSDARSEALRPDALRAIRERITQPLEVDPRDSAACRAAALARVREHFDPACWHIDRRGALSAELSTIRTMHDRETELFDEDSELIFLGGESNRIDAVLCAAVLHLQHANRKFPVPPERVTVYDAGHWDPLNAAFNGVMQGLWKTLLRPAVATGGARETCRFILTGGYKGVVMDIAVRLGKDCASTHIYYLHEQAQRDAPHRGLITLEIDAGDVWWQLQ